MRTTTGAMIAKWPMYDPPAVRDDVDALWDAWRRELERAGFDAPVRLDRAARDAAALASPRLLVSQTCGLPWVRHYRTSLALAGTPDFGIDALAPGLYRSRFLVRSDDPREHLHEFRAATFALNSTDSLSGCVAPMLEVVALGGSGGGEGKPFFDRLVLTGSHAASMRAVVDGRADLAAIDAVTFRLLDESGAADGLRTLGCTRAMPGLPLVTPQGRDVEPIARAFERALDALDAGVRGRLGLRGLARLGPEDYAVVAAADRATRASVAAHRRMPLEGPAP